MEMGPDMFYMVGRTFQYFKNSDGGGQKETE